MKPTAWQRDPTIVSVIMCSFRGWGTHLRNPRTGKAQHQTEFQIPDGPLTNAQGIYRYLHERFPKQVPLRRWGYHSVYDVLRRFGVCRGHLRDRTFTGERVGEQPQIAVEEALVISAVHGNVMLTPQGTPRLDIPDSTIAARVRRDYDGLDDGGQPTFTPEGYNMTLTPYLTHLHQITGRTVTRAAVIRYVADRLPAWVRVSLESAA